MPSPVAFELGRRLCRRLLAVCFVTYAVSPCETVAVMSCQTIRARQGSPGPAEVTTARGPTLSAAPVRKA